MLEPLLFLIGLAGVAFMIYAFHVMKMLNRTARIVAISGLMLLAILFGNRILAPGQVRTVPNQFPFFDSPSVSPRAVRGWQETPFIVLELILAEIGNLNGGSVPASPSPSPSLSPSPASPSPAPSVPASPASPSPAQPAPSPSPTPAQPSPQPSPDPYPDRYPDNPYPGDPYPGDPYPVPSPSPSPSPTPYPDQPAPDYEPPYEPQPSRPRPQPIPGWW